MRKFTDIFRFGPEIYKALLLLISLGIIVYLYPAQHVFLYKFELNKPWTYPDLYAPYDFVVAYSPEEIARKTDSVKSSVPVILKKENINREQLLKKIQSDFDRLFQADSTRDNNFNLIRGIIDSIYKKGLMNIADSAGRKKFLVRQGKNLSGKFIHPFSFSRASEFLNDTVRKIFPQQKDSIIAILFAHLKPNLVYDKEYSEKMLREKLKELNPNKRIIYKGELIISKGKKIDQSVFEVLQSLKRSYYEDSQILRIKIFGLFLASFIFLLLLLYFIREYNRDLFDDNPGISLVFLMIILLVSAFFLVIKYFPGYFYLIPVIIAPFILKSFFNWRIAFLVSLTIILIVSFAIPDPFEFLILQIPAAWIASVGSEDLTKRSKMFVEVGKIVLLYVFLYIAYHMAVSGDWRHIPPAIFLLFVINGFLAVALVHELILIFEKFLGLVSDVSLLELLNTNNKLLKKLAEKAPGTFQHSLQVANLAEAIANELGANSLLVRVGALYHDIGKTQNPKYFTENQLEDYNPHDDLSPEKSAEIIIKHVIDGIEMARRSGLPEKVIDFIRTHHGTDTVQYFYNKAKEKNPEVDIRLFQYPGPNPFSKETAIVMMADSVEAASKSLKNPTKEQMDDLVDKIIDAKVRAGLLNNADITMKEILEAKKVLKNKLRSIYHPRIEYPEQIFDKNTKKS